MLADTAAAAQFTDFLPQIALVAALAALAGWLLKGMLTKPTPAKTAVSNETPARDRSKNLEASLEKSKAAQKELKSQLETLQAASVPTATFEATTAELDRARKSLESEAKRTSALEADLKKAQDTIRNLNSRANDADKVQKDRSFALENELSKVRQQLAQIEARPDDTASLHAEIERLRESVAVSSRFAGEVRKREAEAQEALAKAQAQLADMKDPSRVAAPAPKKVGPVGDSDRVAAAKAEVLRLVEKNKQESKPEPEISPAISAEAAPEVDTDVAPEATVELSPETTPEITPEATPEVAPEVATEASETAPEITPEVTAEVSRATIQSEFPLTAEAEPLLESVEAEEKEKAGSV